VRWLVLLAAFAGGCDVFIGDDGRRGEGEGEPIAAEGEGDVGGEGEGEGEGEDELDCTEVPRVTYGTWGSGFLTANCQGCHASTATWRLDHPGQIADDVHFDDEGQVALFADRIGARVFGATMPPAGGLIDGDLDRLHIWLTCFPPQPR
jgi:predicted CxxxxCH...CXXCH cytochrome family protein